MTIIALCKTEYQTAFYLNVQDRWAWWVCVCDCPQELPSGQIPHSHLQKGQKQSKNHHLKSHVRDKPLYGMLTSGLCWSPWLIPHNVLLNAQNAGSADKRTRPWSNHGVQCSIARIQYGRPNYITHEPGFEPSSCVQRLFDTLANHRTQ